jgi:hypothetical protein
MSVRVSTTSPAVLVASIWSHLSAPSLAVILATIPFCGSPVLAAARAGWMLSESGQPAASVMSQPARSALVPMRLSLSRSARAAALAPVTVPPRS